MAAARGPGTRPKHAAPRSSSAVLAASIRPAAASHAADHTRATCDCRRCWPQCRMTHAAALPNRGSCRLQQGASPTTDVAAVVRRPYHMSQRHDVFRANMLSGLQYCAPPLPGAQRLQQLSSNHSGKAQRGQQRWGPSRIREKAVGCSCRAQRPRARFGPGAAVANDGGGLTVSLAHASRLHGAAGWWNADRSNCAVPGARGLTQTWQEKQKWDTRVARETTCARQEGQPPRLHFCVENRLSTQPLTQGLGRRNGSRFRFPW